MIAMETITRKELRALGFWNLGGILDEVLPCHEVSWIGLSQQFLGGSSSILYPLVIQHSYGIDGPFIDDDDY
jgi:hypothetical protein